VLFISLMFLFSPSFGPSTSSKILTFCAFTCRPPNQFLAFISIILTQKTVTYMLLHALCVPSGRTRSWGLRSL
jgi:hypothetical protein